MEICFDIISFFAGGCLIPTSVAERFKHKDQLKIQTFIIQQTA